MKKRFTLLIAITVLLLGGSGGKVWGQLLKPVEQQSKPGLRAYGDMDGGLTGNTGSSTADPGASGFTRGIQGGFTADNNFGAGESGTIIPNTSVNSQDAGIWNGGSNVILNPFAQEDGIITVGGAINHIGHQVTGGNQAIGAGFNNSRYHPSATATTTLSNFTATGNYSVVPCGGGSWSWSPANVSSNTTWNPTPLPGFWAASTTHGATTFTVNAPIVPNASESFFAATVPAGPAETSVTVNTGGVPQINSGQPWYLQMFNFIENKWYYYKTDLGQDSHSLAAPVITYDGKTVSGCSLVTDPSSTQGAAVTHTWVTYTTVDYRGGTTINSRIVLAGGSHVRLRGHLSTTYSIGTGALGTTKAYLDLPSSHYTLMNNENFDASVTAFTVSNLSPMGTDAVMGVNKEFLKGTTNPTMKTNTAGGTILIGSTTSSASQVVMTVQSVPTNPGSFAGKTFAKSTTAGSLINYLGYELPIHGSANLGNFGNNSVTLLNTSMFGTASPAVGAGLMQIYNHSCNPLTFNSGPWTFALSTGHLLIEGSETVNFEQTQTFTGGTTANLTINGGRVNFDAAHTYNSGSTTGDYGVYGYKLNYTAEPFVTCYGTDPVAGSYLYGGLPVHNTVGTRGYFCGSGDIYVKAGAAVSVTNASAVTGETRWQAANDIETNENITFSHAGSGATVWQAGHDIKTQGGSSKTVQFAHTAGIGTTTWKADNDISTKTLIDFSNGAGAIGTTEWIARRNITTDENVKFKRESATGTTTWTAYNNITTNKEIDFENTASPMNVTTGWTAYANITTNDNVTFANTNNAGPTSWLAYNDITTNGIAKLVKFVNTGSQGTTSWEARNGSITTNTQVQFDHSAASLTVPGDHVTWTAGKHITTNNTVLFDYLSDNKIEWWAKNGGIYVNDQVDINRLNIGSGETYLHAGNATYNYLKPYTNCATTANVSNDIHIESIFNYTEPTGAGSGSKVTWYAENDILTNQSCEAAGGSHPMLGPAPVTFTVGSASKTTTLWDAQRNINTKGRVDYLYTGAPNMGDLTWLSRGGYIQTERPVNVRYSSDNKVSFRAENMLFDLPDAAAALNANVTGRRGNIHTFDSLWIVRNNTGVGLTEVKAENHIWTAMVDYEDQSSAGNSMDVISHKGDIYLGHNDGTTTNVAYPYYLSSSVSTLPLFQLTQQNPTAGCNWPMASNVSYDLNRFNYTVNALNQTGHLFVKAGYMDNTDTGAPAEGGNIYFTHINEALALNSNHNTEVSIPFSNWYVCNGNFSGHGAREYYEKAGIIGGVGRCAINTKQPIAANNTLCTDTGLIYRGFNGQLLFDAGTRGNIIINNGSYLTFQDGTGNTEFRTRWGDIDMRYPFDVDSMRGSLLYLASSDLPNKLKVNVCGCDEKRNNIYLQDFKYNPIVNSGSIFVGADNNIKLQYGGLKNIATERDPFFSNNAGYRCGQQYHCDSDTSENLARDLILNFAKDKGGIGAPITTGGFAAVASDLIDVYKQMIYTGGQGAGMSSVPKYGSLHGESVAGFGLYIKTQANKTNWGRSAFDFKNMNACWPPKCDEPCKLPNAILQNVARVTFHSDARIYTENQRSYIGSPVLETFGNLDLNTHNNKGGKTSITIQTDSLIVHDSLIIDGKLTKFTTWSNLYRDMPIVKLGHQRFTPPFTEDGKVCAPCFIHEKTTGKYSKRTALDTLYVTYRNGAAMPRLHTLVADHTVLSFLTDSFDHRSGDPTINAKFYTDTFKVRNHVELYTDQKHERDGHFELISETQMSSKDYAGIYARHLHMEPIAPTCAADFPYSQLWLPDPALDVITTSTFGGYGWIHADVHVEIEATLAPGFASLREKGNYCYELKAGTLKMQDLRLDKGAELRYTIGHEEGFNGEKADCIEVDEITMYGSVFINVEKRCGQKFEEGCYPIIRYNSVAVDTVNLNNLKLKTMKIDGYRLSLDTSIPGIVYLCVGEVSLPSITRAIHIPQTAGVTTTPTWGTHYIASQDNFKFKAKYTTSQPLKVVTDRLVNGKEEELNGRLNANGEYEYVINKVIQNIVLKFGPDYATDNISIDGRAVWSHNNTVYIRVETDDIASIYSVAGQLVERMELQPGSSSVLMDRGVYIVTLKDGSVHKVIVK